MSVELPPRGTIESYTILHMPPDGFKAPLLLALVRLEGDAMILSLGDADASDDIEIGSRVSIETDQSERFRFKTI
ncbi:hypothetical protein EU546_08705 [Candidatus Thorarchaeota archaeon]|nr:MAG: hypothetical protein EU546_08705 [Candidatus Thorarchaeota archaeon]